MEGEGEERGCSSSPGAPMHSRRDSLVSVDGLADDGARLEEVGVVTCVVRGEDSDCLPPIPQRTRLQEEA